MLASFSYALSPWINHLNLGVMPGHATSDLRLCSQLHDITAPLFPRVTSMQKAHLWKALQLRCPWELARQTWATWVAEKPDNILEWPLGRPNTPSRWTCSRCTLIGPIPWGHSGPLCHSLSLSLSSLWTSHAACSIAIAGVRLATPGDWQCNGGSQ